LRRPFVGEECASDTRQRDVHRWEVDGNFIGKAARVVTVLARDDRN
jgi:hypothetical protein